MSLSGGKRESIASSIDDDHIYSEANFRRFSDLNIRRASPLMSNVNPLPSSMRRSKYAPQRAHSLGNYRISHYKQEILNYGK